MAGKKFPLHFTILTLVLSLTSAVFSQLPGGVQAQTPRVSISRSIPNSWNFDPPKRGNPDNREGGATRGPDGCIPEQDKALTALGPSSSSTKSGVSLTQMGYPTLYWYVPRTSAQSVQFVLSNDQEQKVYSTTLPISGRSGIISLKLPSSAKSLPLEANREYFWELTLVCDPQNDQNPYIEGSIKRVTAQPGLAARIEKATPEERVALYANARLWHETVLTLAELRRSRPYDPALRAAWEKLLGSAGLNKIAKEPFISF